MRKRLPAALAIAAVAAVVVYFGWHLFAPPTPPPARQAAELTRGTGGQPAPATGGGQGTTGGQQAAAAPTPSSPEVPAPAIRYCSPQHDPADTKALKRAGGLVAIFRNEASLPAPYACARRYLAHGGSVDAVDPRPNSKHLTPLLFAIERNDPKMVKFLLAHGANPNKRGGPKHIRPYGYAIYLALHNQSTDYNKVISILNSAMNQGAQGSAS